MMESPEVKSKIKEIIAGMFDIKPEEVAEQKPFAEMAKYDSMRALEFLAKAENEFNVIIDPDLLLKMKTVDGSTEVILGLLRAV